MKYPLRISIYHQQGVVLVIALIVLVGLTLAGLALIRSVDTTNIIAGNMAFQQAATQAGDMGTESAILWLEANNTGTNLHASSFNNGYSAIRQDPGVGQSWDSFWTTVLVPNAQFVTLAMDTSTGNSVSYTIHRLCNQIGDPTVPGTGCAVSQTSVTPAGSSKGAGVVALQYNSQILYRITTRITGPRNTVSYVQAVVAM